MFYIQGEAVGKYCKVPYLKGGFRVENLPENLDFRPPYRYGSRQINVIMANADAIKFVIEPTENCSPTPNLGRRTRGTSHTSRFSKSVSLANGTLSPVPTIAEVLSKVTGEDVIPEGEVIEEEDVEITLRLSQVERLVLLGKGESHFTADAWMAVGANMQHENATTGCVLPVYTDADGIDYWLFYCLERLETVLSGKPSKRLHGFWMDAEIDGRTYRLLHKERSFIYCKNIIKSSICPLYFTLCLPVKEDSIFSIPETFHETVMEVLHSKMYL